MTALNFILTMVMAITSRSITEYLSVMFMISCVLNLKAFIYCFDHYIGQSLLEFVGHGFVAMIVKLVSKRKSGLDTIFFFS